MVIEEDLRRVALSLPGSVEKPYNRLPSFRVRGNMFIRIHELPDAFLVRCAGLEERDELLKAEPLKFSSRPITLASADNWVFSETPAMNSQVNGLLIAENRERA